MKLESSNRVRLIGRRKDDLRQMLQPESFKDLEPVHLRHLDIEENYIGPLFLDRREGLLAVAAFTYDLDLGVLLQHSANERASERLVIRDQGLDPALVHRGKAFGSLVRKGSCIATVTPPS